MNLVDTIRDYIMGQAYQSPGTYKFILPSYSAKVLWSVGDKLREAVTVSEGQGLNIRFIYQIAKRLGEKWETESNSDAKQYYDLVKTAGWYNQDNNLTFYRNLLRDSDTDYLLIILAGYEDIDDQSSLADFFHLDQKSIWEICLRGSFYTWVERLFAPRVNTEDNQSYLLAIADVLNNLYLQGTTDLIGVNGFLSKIDVKYVTNGNEAFRAVLDNLPYFKLPRMNGLARSNSKKGFAKYVGSAQEFFNYSMFLNKTERDKALKKVGDYRKADPNSRTEPEEEELGCFKCVDELVAAIEDYITNRSKEAKKNLYTADFIFIFDNVLGYKEKKETKPKPKTAKKLRGIAPEVFLRAIWLTVGEAKKWGKGKKVFLGESIQNIIVSSILFKHDFDIGGEDYEHESAERFLRICLGGIDEYLPKHLRIKTGPNDDDRIILVKTALCPSCDDASISYLKTKTAEPFLKFQVVLETSDVEYPKEFLWMLPENDPSRLMVHLFEWARAMFLECGDALPAYAMPYISEIFMSRDEEESIRLTEAALKTDKCSVINLIKSSELNGDKGLPLLRHSTQHYQILLNEIYNKGLFTALENNFTAVRKACVNMYKHYIENSNQSMIGPMLLKAFNIVDEGSKNNQQWIWDEHLDAAIVSPLHPALLEMMIHQQAFLCESFCYYVGYALRETGDTLLAEKQWEKVVDLARIQRPIFGTLRGFERNLDTTMHDYRYLHLFGRCPDSTSFLNSRLLLEYLDDEELDDTDLFKESRASSLIHQLLIDYIKLHQYAYDGITVAAYCGREIQPIIAGIDSFLANILNNRNEIFALRLVIYSDSKDDSSVMRWINAWKDRWQRAELRTSARHYDKCRISISYRVISREHNSEQFRHLLEQTDTDISIFMDFIDLMVSHFETLGDETDLPEDYRRFPILEKVSSRKIGGGHSSRRERVLSNQRFQLASFHTEVMAHLRNKDASPSKRHAVISYCDYEPWRDVIDAAHKQSGWVVCIDPSIDEHLLLRVASEDTKAREIVGLGTGVGPHGEDNFTVSTEQFSLVDIKRKIAAQVRALFGPLGDDDVGEIAKCLMQEAFHVAGLSLVKATGPIRFVREFIANTMVRKLLVRDQNAFCDDIISLDAYLHWFSDAEDGKRPDLFRIKANIVNGYFQIEVQLIECKLAQQSEGFLERARDQLENGLKELINRFKPREKDQRAGIDDRPDQRFWWMQLHRLVASKGSSDTTNYKDTLVALERLSEGFYSISWQAAVMAFWTDIDKNTLYHLNGWQYSFGNQELFISVANAGKDFIKRVCVDNHQADIFDNNSRIKFELDPSTITTGQSQGYDRDDIAVEPESNNSVEQIQQQESEQKLEPGIEETEKEMDTTQNSSGDESADIHQVPNRILLGPSTPTHDLYWEFGHPDLPNRHILVFGASGTGKTYLIQALMCEFSKTNTNSLVVDYSNGFITKQLDSVTVARLNPKQHIVRKEPLPINPFRQQCDYIEEYALEETPANTADRVSGVFSNVYNLGDQQKAALYNAIREGVEEQGTDFNLNRLIDKLEEIKAGGGPNAASYATLINKIQAFVDMHPFGSEDLESWEKLYLDEQNSCHVLQLIGFSKEMQRLITEFSLIDLYWYYRANGNQYKPRVIILDEIQNLDHRLDSPLGQFLTEGRKFGICLVLATQTLSNLDKDERDRLFQASHKLFFRPADTEIKSFATILSDATGDKVDDWINRLSKLKRGECYSLGHGINEKTGKLDINRWAKIKVSSLEERFKSEGE